MESIENKTFDEIAVGDSASLTRKLHYRDIKAFAAVSGDYNTTHLEQAFLTDRMQYEVTAHGMWGAALISSVLGNQLPGSGTVYVGQTLEFLESMLPGDELTVTVTVAEKLADRKVRLRCECINQDGKTVVRGLATVIAPAQKSSQPRTDRPQLFLHEEGNRHKAMIALAGDLPPVITAVIHPTDEVSLLGALDAADARLITPILVGPAAKIHAVAQKAGVDISGYQIEDVAHSHAAARRGVDMVNSGDVAALMKGSLHTDELMSEVVHKAHGLRTGRRISHIFVMDVPAWKKPLLITDAAININPDLNAKRDIVQNAIDLSRIMGTELPKVAILSAVETVNPEMIATLDAAALCKMADRGQITGGLLDGPLAFDNAISKAAARTKHIVSDVAGDVDILLVPDLESGNMLAKQLDYLAGATGAGIVIGAQVPIILTSRSDGRLARMASCALAAMVAASRVEKAHD